MEGLWLAAVWQEGAPGALAKWTVLPLAGWTALQELSRRPSWRVSSVLDEAKMARGAAGLGV